MKKRNYLLVLSRLLSQGYHGVEGYTIGLAQDLLRRGHTVNIVHPEQEVLHPEGQISSRLVDGVNVYSINQHAPLNANNLIFYNPSISQYFKALVQKIKPDLVHFQELHGFTAESTRVCSSLHIPVVYTMHDFYLICEQLHLNLPDKTYCDKGPESVSKCSQCYCQRLMLSPSQSNMIRVYNQFNLRRNYLFASKEWIDTVISPSEFLIKHLKLYGYTHPSVLCLPLGLKEQRTFPPRKVMGKIHFGFIGNLYSIKGIDLLIQAFNTIDPNTAQLDLYGNAPDLIYYETIKKLVKPGSPIKFHGAYNQDELPTILSKMDVAIIPSRFENYCTTIRECLFAKVPVIASNAGGNPEIVHDGVDGYLFQSGDYHDLAQKMRLIIQHPDQIEILRRGIPHIQTVQEEVDQIEQVYETMILSKSKLGANVG